MVLENWVKVREFDDLEWARRNRYLVQVDQMPAVLLFQGQPVDDPPGLALRSPGERSSAGSQESAAYELWVQSRDEVRAGHILNMHHRVTFEVNPTPTGTKVVLGFFAIVLWLTAMGWTCGFVMTGGQQALTMLAAIGAFYAVVLAGLYSWYIRLKK